MNDYQTKLQYFAALLQIQSQIGCKLSGVGCQANLDNCRTRIVPGKKYDKVDVGHSGRFMVDKATGEIYGIKGYGQIHKGRTYGTLDTTANFWWGGYHPRTIDARYSAPAGWKDMIADCDTETEAEKAAWEARRAARDRQLHGEAPAVITEVETPYGPETRYTKLNIVDTSKPEASRTEIHVTTDSAYPSLVINGHAL